MSQKRCPKKCVPKKVSQKYFLPVATAVQRHRNIDIWRLQWSARSALQNPLLLWQKVCRKKVSLKWVPKMCPKKGVLKMCPKNIDILSSEWLWESVLVFTEIVQKHTTQQNMQKWKSKLHLNSATTTNIKT